MNKLSSVVMLPLLFSSLFLQNCCMQNTATTITASSSNQPSAQEPFYTELLMQDINPISFGFNRKADTEQFLATLQRIASFLAFQQRFLDRIDRIKDKTIEELLQTKTLKKFLPLPLPKITNPENIHTEPTIKIYLLSEYIDQKLKTIKKPSFGPLANYDLTTSIHNYARYCLDLLDKNFQSLELINRGYSARKKIESLLNFYFSAIVQLAFDYQYQEITRVLRLAIHSLKRTSKNQHDYSVYLLDPYHPADKEFTYWLLDSLLTEKERSDYLPVVENICREESETDPVSAEEMVQKSMKDAPNTTTTTSSITATCKKKKKGRKNNVQKKQQPSTLDHGLPSRYEIAHATTKQENRQATINDPDNGLTIKLDLDGQTYPMHNQSHELFTKHYGAHIQGWFDNANKKLRTMGKNKSKLKLRQALIQKNRFCPLADLFIAAIGRKYLELKNPHATGKMTPVTTIWIDGSKDSCQALPGPEKGQRLSQLFGLDQDTLAQWLWHAEMYGFEPRIRIDVDAQITLAKAGTAQSGLLKYVIDPKSEQIIERTMELDTFPPILKS